MMELEKKVRINSLYIVRGMVIVIMTLDHVRDYIHADAFIYNPTDLNHTTPAIFFTRWITHFCAPAFCFLAGISAFIGGQRKTKRDLSLFLLKRGLWLILLELTVLDFGWYFDIRFRTFGLIVIWSLGICMIFLAGLIYLPFKIAVILCSSLILFHNLLDSIHLPGSFFWSLIHEPALFTFGNSKIDIGYPIVPWIGVMGLGYCFGKIYTQGYDTELRKKTLILAGWAAIIAFVILRSINMYGDPSKWTSLDNMLTTALSFINLTKYPPSLLFLLITLGPVLITLAYAEKWKGRVIQFFMVFGKVPFFYFIAHIYLSHLIAMICFAISGFGWNKMILKSWITQDPNLQGTGYSLVFTYVVWISVVVMLYPFCKKYGAYKASHPEKWWLQYL